MPGRATYHKEGEAKVVWASFSLSFLNRGEVLVQRRCDDEQLSSINHIMWSCGSLVIPKRKIAGTP